MDAETPRINWSSDNLESEWTKFENHAKLMFIGPLAGKTAKQQCAYLLIWAGEQGREIFSTFDLIEAEKEDVDTYLTKFREYAAPKRNQVFSRYIFQKHDQKQESIDKYITDLKILVKPCGYTDKDEMLRDRIVGGVANPKIREKLLSVGDTLSLNQTVTICRAFETTQAQLKTFEGREIKQEIDSIAKSRPHPKSKKPECYFCGGTYSQNHICPAKGKTCSKCRKPNHFAKVCRRSEKKAVHTVEDGEALSETADDTDEVFLYTIQNSTREDEAFAELSIEGQMCIKFKIDTGAQVNVLPVQYYNKLPIKPSLIKGSHKLTSYCGSAIPYAGISHLTCRYKDGKTQSHAFYIVRSNTTPIVGLKTCKDLELIKLILNIQKEGGTTSAYSQLVKEYKDIFEGIGNLENKCEIHLKENAVPMVYPARKVPLAMKQKLKDELDRLEALNIIGKVSEPTDWVNAMVMVEKKDGSVRLCIEPVDLNKAMKHLWLRIQSSQQD